MAYKVNIGATEMSGSLTVNSDYAYYGDGSNLSGISTSTVTTNTSTSASTHYIPFVNQSTGETGETLYIHDSIALNPNTNLVTLQGALTIGGALAGGTSYSGSAGLTGSSLVLGQGNVMLSRDGTIGSAGAAVLDTGGVGSSFAGGLGIGGGYGDTGITLSAAGVITANGAITSDGAVTGGSLTDGTLSISSGAITGGTSYSGSAGLSGSSLVIGLGNVMLSRDGTVDISGDLNANGVLVIGNGVRYGSIDVKTSHTTLTSADSIIVVSGSSGAISLSLPISPTEGEFFMIKRSAYMTAGDVTIYSGSATGGKYIDGAESVVLETVGAAVSLVYDDTTASGSWNVF